MRCFLIGHSHITTMEWAAQLPTSIAHTQDQIEFVFLPLSDPRNYPLTRDGSLSLASCNTHTLKFLDEEGAFSDEKDVIVSCLGGNEHNVMGLLAEPVPFDFVLPGESNVEHNGYVHIPYDMIYDTIAQASMHWINFLVALQRDGKRIQAHLQSPPPVASRAHLELHLDKYFLAKTERPQVTEPAILRKLWKTAERVIRSRIEPGNIAFIPAPSAALDLEGLLVREGWHSDATHASPWYSELALNAVYETLRRESK